MIHEHLKSYRVGIRRCLERHHPEVRQAPLGEDQWSLEVALGQERQRAGSTLRGVGLPLRFAQEFIAPLFSENADWAFLRSHSPEELVGMVFDMSRKLLRWSRNGTLNKEGSVETQGTQFLPFGETRQFHQQPCTPATVLRRVRLVQHLWRDQSPPRILLLGDDDLFSLALARTTNWSSTVVEIDPKVLDVIEAHRIPAIRTVLHDLREPLPGDLRGQFDVIMADPMYTREGLNIFLKAASAAFGENPNRLFFLSFNDIFTGRSHLPGAIRQLEQESHLHQIARLPMFNVYTIPARRREQLKVAARLFFSSPLLQTMMDFPVTFSDMYVFGTQRRRD